MFNAVTVVDVKITSFHFTPILIRINLANIQPLGQSSQIHAGDLR